MLLVFLQPLVTSGFFYYLCIVELPYSTRVNITSQSLLRLAFFFIVFLYAKTIRRNPWCDGGAICQKKNHKHLIFKHLWFVFRSPTGNRTRIYGLGNRHSIHWTIRPTYFASAKIILFFYQAIFFIAAIFAPHCTDAKFCVSTRNLKPETLNFEQLAT